MASGFKKLVQTLLYLLIMSSFMFDSYYKYSNLVAEADMLRSKYQLFQEFTQRMFGVGFPVDSQTISRNS